jgi:hypothetical protein
MTFGNVVPHFIEWMEDSEFTELSSSLKCRQKPAGPQSFARQGACGLTEADDN